MLDRKIEPKIFSPVDFDYHLPDCNSIVFQNGINVHYFSDDLQPVMQLEMVFKAGLWYENQNGIAQATAGLLKSGTSKMTSFQINEMFEQYGASVKTVAGPDFASITISCLTKHLSKVLPVVADMLLDTQFPQHEIDIFIQNAKQRLSVQLLKSDFVANRKIDEFLFGIQHPYGKYSVIKDYEAINQQALSNHLKTYYSNNNCSIFIAGSFADSDIELINQHFGKTNWNNENTIVEPIFKAHSTVEKKHRINNDQKGVQGSIRIASHFPNKHHEDFYPMIVLNTILGGYFGSRLMSNIREDKGYTYGIHSYMYNQVNQSAYLITTEAGKDVCEAAIKEIYYEMDVLKNELVDAEELELVKNYLLGTILGDLDGAFQIMQRWKSLILNGFTKERFNKNIDLYKHITPEQLQALANKYYQQENFYELVVI